MMVDLAVAHTHDGLELAIIAPPGALDRDWSELGIRRMLVPHAERNPRDLARTARSVRRALQSWGPDVVHAHNVKATAMALAGTRGAPGRLPVLSTLHGVAPDQLRASALILRQAAAVAAVSEDLRRAVVSKGLSAAAVTVVHNGVNEITALDPETRRRYDDELELGNTVIAIVGRLAPEKAHHRLLDAMVSVLHDRPDAVLLVVGDGACREELEARTQALGIAGAVRFTGERRDARALIDRADLLVFSSEREGHSIAALEALAAGTPVVSTDVSGMRELLDDGRGVVVADWAPAALATTIVELLNDEPRRLEMGRAGQEFVRRELSAQAMQRRYREIYERLASRRP